MPCAQVRRVSSGPGIIAHLSVYTSLVHNRIDFVGCHTRLDGRSPNVKHFSRQPAHLAHSGYSLVVQDCDLVALNVRVVGNTRLRPFRVRYRLGNHPLLGERVYRSQAASKRIGRKGIEVAGFWIDLRNDARRDQVRQRVLTLVHLLVLALRKISMDRPHRRPTSVPSSS